jgi:hypothetical protein
MSKESAVKLALVAGFGGAMLFILSLTLSPKETFVAQSYQSRVR